MAEKFWAPPPTPAPEVKLCRQCAEPITKAARICNQCKSHQDWRGYLGMSQSVLALLIAIISVSTVFVPILKDALTPKNSDFYFSVQRVYEGGVAILASNSGLRPGTVSQAIVIVDFPAKFEPEDDQISANLFPTDTVVVAPQKTELIRFSPTKIENWPKTSGMNYGELDVEVRIYHTDFYGDQKFRIIEMDLSHKIALKKLFPRSS